MPPVGETLVAKIGTDVSWKQTLYDDANPPAVVTIFTSSDTFEANVWPGDDRAVTFSPTCAWIDAPNGEYSVSIAASQTSALAEGIYRLEVLITHSSKVYTAFDGRLQLTATAGSATALPTYGSYEDMKLYAPWIEDLVDPNEDQIGFLEQRNQARKWLDSLAQAHYRIQPYATTGYSFTLTNPFAAMRSGVEDTTLRDWLDDDRLVITNRIKEAVAKYAISLVLRAQLSPNRIATTSSYAQLATHFMADAKMIATTLTLGIDTSTVADSEPDLFINLGSADVIYG